MIEKRAASLIEELILKVGNLEGQLQEKVAAEDLRQEDAKKKGISDVFGGNVSLKGFNGNDLDAVEKFAGMVVNDDYGRISEDSSNRSVNGAHDSFNSFFNRK